MDGDGTSARIARVVNQYANHITDLQHLYGNLDRTLPELVTDVFIILSQIVYQNELEFGFKKVPYCIESYQYPLFFLFIQKSMKTVAIQMDLCYKRRGDTVDCEPWCNVSINNIFILLQCIRQDLDLLYPEGYADQFDCPLKSFGLKSFLRQSISFTKEAAAILEAKMIPVTQVQKFVDKLKQLRSVSQLLVNCPDDHCAICKVEKLREDTNFAVLDCCQHLFCVFCVKLWFEHSRTCPLCRDKVTSSYTSFYIKNKFIRNEAQAGTSSNEGK